MRRIARMDDPTKRELQIMKSEVLADCKGDVLALSRMLQQEQEEIQHVALKPKKNKYYQMKFNLAELHRT